MRNKILGITLFLTLSFIVNYTFQQRDGNMKWQDLVLSNIEALANYEMGPIGTNWKTYMTECTYTKGIDYGLVYTVSYTATKEVCGKGSGWCMSPAGC